MIRRPPRSTLDRSSAASDVYKRQALWRGWQLGAGDDDRAAGADGGAAARGRRDGDVLSLIHISEPTRPY